MQQPRTLSLVWRRNILEMVLEAYFIREVLLGHIRRPLRTVVIESNAPMPYLDDALYVSFGPELAGHLRAARAQGVKNIGSCTWRTSTDLPAAYAPYADADAPKVIDAIEEKRIAVLDWWTRFKELQQKRIKDLIDRSFDRAYK